MPANDARPVPDAGRATPKVNDETPFRPHRSATRRQLWWFAGLGVVGVGLAAYVVGSGRFGQDTWNVTSSIAIGALTAVLAVISHFQGERHGRLAWEIHQWERSRTLEVDRQEAQERQKLRRREDSAALEAALREKYGGTNVDYRDKLLNDKPSTHELIMLAHKAKLNEGRSLSLKYACSLNGAFWAAANRAIKVEAARQLEAMGHLKEAEYEERRRVAEIDRMIDESIDSAHDNESDEERGVRHREEIDDLIEQYIDGARALGWKPPELPRGVLMVE